MDTTTQDTIAARHCAAIAAAETSVLGRAVDAAALDAVHTFGALDGRVRMVVVYGDGSALLLRPAGPRPVTLEAGLTAVGRLGADEVISLLRSPQRGVREAAVTLLPDVVLAR